MKTVRLRNGAVVTGSAVGTVMLCLEAVRAEKATAFYDLVMKCRDGDYQFSAGSEGYLRALELVDDSGDVHEVVRSIVLSAVEGDGLEKRLLSSPLAREESP